MVGRAGFSRSRVHLYELTSLDCCDADSTELAQSQDTLASKPTLTAFDVDGTKLTPSQRDKSYGRGGIRIKQH
eukprot:1139034-Pelagomonas_calceolata.AAC.2